MPITTAQIAVSNAGPVLLASGAGGTAAAPVSAAVRNADTVNSIFVGGAGVTAAAGFEVKPGTTFAVDLVTGDTLHGIASVAGPVAAHVVRTRQ